MQFLRTPRLTWTWQNIRNAILSYTHVGLLWCGILQFWVSSWIPEWDEKINMAGEVIHTQLHSSTLASEFCRSPHPKKFINFIIHLKSTLEICYIWVKSLPSFFRKSSVRGPSTSWTWLVMLDDQNPVFRSAIFPC